MSGFSSGALNSPWQLAWSSLAADEEQSRIPLNSKRLLQAARPLVSENHQSASKFPAFDLRDAPLYQQAPC
jgi:hypothetical protein